MWTNSRDMTSCDVFIEASKIEVNPSFSNDFKLLLIYSRDTRSFRLVLVQFVGMYAACHRISVCVRVFISKSLCVSYTHNYN